VIGIGTWNMERDDRGSAIAAIRRALDLGMTHVDTAELYGQGRVEALVREAIAGRRDEVFLVSKVLPQNASRQGTIKACEASLSRLGTDRLDGYLLHWPGRFPIADTVAAFEELVAAGKIRSWGVSNFDERGLAEVVRIAGPGKVACNQVLYHLEERRVEHAVLPACRSGQTSLVAYSPFGSTPRPWGRAAPALAAIANERGVSAHAVALAFLVRDPVVLAIPKTSTVAHVDANAAGDLDLSAAEIAKIEAAFPLGPRRTGVATI
jgi:diketogulonate reductase-like aldo/keto reductase